MKWISTLALLVAFNTSAAKSIQNQYIIKIDKKKFKNLKSTGIRIIKPLIEDLGYYLVEDTNKSNESVAINALYSVEGVEMAQADHIVTSRKLNDPKRNELWSLNKQSNNSDIQVSEVWKSHVGGNDKLGNEVVVAVIDEGVDVTHEDLKENMWVNKGEIPGNGIDDDNNGYVDDIHGWNVYDNSGDLIPSDHGTHVAGIIGARGNNRKGISGVNQNVKVMGISGSSGSTSVVLESYGYVLKQKKRFLETNGKEGANVVATNSSFGIDYADCTSGEYPMWNDIYNEMGKVGILSAAATINDHVNVDVNGDVPTGCSSPYIVSVTNTTIDNNKYDYAGYGAKSIDVGAPGTQIFSTIPGDDYGPMTGTSMATPHVAGAIGLLFSGSSKSFLNNYYKNPSVGALALKEVLLNNVSANSDLNGKTLTGGKINLKKAYDAIK